MAESEEELKSLLIKVKEESKKLAYKLTVQKMNSWHLFPCKINVEKHGNTDRIYILGLKITADGGCSHEIIIYLLLGRKAMTNLDSIVKSRDLTLPTKVCLAKDMVFSSSHVWM